MDNTEVKDDVLVPLGSSSKNKRGRPKKAEIQARSKKALRKGQRGRPPGEAAKIRELMARMLITNGDRVLQKTIDIAMTDEHPNQMAAIKLLMDRALPTSYFEKDRAGSRPSINISITGVSGAVETIDTIDPDATDVEFEDYRDE